MQCKINWNSLALEEWEKRYASVRRASLLQSYDYARAACPLYHQRARWGHIFIDGAEAGLVQVMEAGILKNLIHAVMLDNGPLWFDGFGSDAHISAFAREFNDQFPARIGRHRRFLPNSRSAAPIEGAGFKCLKSHGYETAWIDLCQDEEALRTALKPSWRSGLRKAEKAGLSVEWDETGETLPLILTNYQLDKAKKGYDGPSVRILRQMAKIFAPEGRFLAGRAILENRPIAAILILCHGSSATYQIGWSLDEGRKVAAHNLLLWQAVCTLKAKGIKDFDLGGFNDDAEGIKKFKQGMGGETVTYAGHFV